MRSMAGSTSQCRFRRPPVRRNSWSTACRGDKEDNMTRRTLAALCVALLLTATGSRAEIFVSSNDGKQFRPDDTIHPEPDTVSVIDVANGRVKLLGSVAAPVALTGPPNLV